MCAFSILFYSVRPVMRQRQEYNWRAFVIIYWEPQINAGMKIITPLFLQHLITRSKRNITKHNAYQGFFRVLFWGPFQSTDYCTWKSWKTTWRQQLVESEKTKLSMRSLACREVPCFLSTFFSLSFSFSSHCYTVVVLLNNSFHINILFPAYLPCYAGAKHCY